MIRPFGSADAGDSGGVSVDLLTAPLLAAWDFSAPMAVMQAFAPQSVSAGSANFWGVYARSLSVSAFNFKPATITLSYALDPLISFNNNDWVALGQFPNASSINGLSVWKQTATSADIVAFADDALRVIYPDMFLVFQLASPAATDIILGQGSCDMPNLMVWDDSGTLKWGVSFDYDSPSVLRTTDALVDTKAHVICYPQRGDQSLGLWLDSTFYPWTDSTPAGWVGHAFTKGSFDIAIGNATFSIPAAEGLYGELRLYDPLTDAERAAVTAQMMTKWGI